MLRRGSRGGRRRRRGAAEPADTEFTSPPDLGPHVPDGPYDVDDEPNDGLRRIDFGALRIPIVEGTRVHFQVDEASGRPLAVAVTDGATSIELSVFAAPKSSGLWDDVQGEILNSLRANGGFGELSHGPYGTELFMRLPSANTSTPISRRMIGIDGPRWLLRVVVSGKAGADPGAAPLLEEVLRSLVVVRGEEAMPVRDPLPLHLPREVTGQSESAEAAAETPDPPPAPASQRTRVQMQMPVRGVQMSELR